MQSFKVFVEDFNIPPLAQNANNCGPDIGITSGDMENTFPQSLKTITVKLPTNIRRSLKKHGYQRHRLV